MRPDLFAQTIPFDEALRRVLEAALPVEGTQFVPLSDADGRVCAADVVAPADVPTFDRAAMDGYAVQHTDLVNATATTPVELSCIGEIFTGDVPDRPVASGECIAIATGAPIPAGVDAVVMVESTSSNANGRGPTSVSFSAPAHARQNISSRGADIMRGDRVVKRDDPIGPARVGSLAAVGATMVAVYRRPTVAILSTGNEVTPPGRELPPGHVYDVNRFTVEAVVRRHGATTIPVATAGDSVQALEAALDEASACDVIVMSGGSSVGKRDLMLDVVRERGRVVFHGIAVKPGKPTLLALVGTAVVFGMPGNPTSCLSNADMLLVPFLRKMARLPPWQPLTVTAPLARRLTSTSDRHQFYPVRLVDGRVEPAFKSSGDITSMAGADGYVEIPATVAALDAGDTVTVKLF